MAMATEKSVADILDRMDRQARMGRAALIGALGVEALLLGLILWLTDWNDEGQRLLVIVGILGYSIIVLGLAALGAHVSRVGARIVAALDPRAG